MRSPTNNRITQTAHLSSLAVDHSASPDPFVYAPESGRIDSYQYRGSGTNSAGNVLRLAGKTGMHSFCHLEETYVKPGATVVEGQKLAKMGFTGYTVPSGPAGRHLHYYILTPNGYVYPPTLYKQGAGDMADRTQVNNLYKAIMHREGDKGGLDNYTGRDANTIVAEFMGSQEFKNHQAFLNSATKTITDLQTALRNEQSKPPEVVTKEVIKIVKEVERIEVPVEVIVEKDPSWLVKVREFINNFLRGK